MEDLAVYLRLNSRSSMSQVRMGRMEITNIIGGTSDPDILPKSVRDWVFESVGVDLRSPN